MLHPPSGYEQCCAVGSEITPISHMTEEAGGGQETDSGQTRTLSSQGLPGASFLSPAVPVVTPQKLGRERRRRAEGGGGGGGACGPERPRSLFRSPKAGPASPGSVGKSKLKGRPANYQTGLPVTMAVSLHSEAPHCCGPHHQGT